MSWNKNTVNMSKLDSIADILTILEVPFFVTSINVVNGVGINDMMYDENGPAGTTDYDLRQLVSEKLVVLESIYRTIDCDDDDFIRSDTFKPNDVPLDWESVISQEAEPDIEDVME